MSQEENAGRVSIPLQRELGAGLELKEPKNTQHYKPLEEPRAYPLELTENLHICLGMKKANINGQLLCGAKEKKDSRLSLLAIDR